MAIAIESRQTMVAKTTSRTIYGNRVKSIAIIDGTVSKSSCH